MQRFNAKANLLLKNEIVRISVRSGQPWSMIRDEMSKLAVPMEGNPDIVYPAVMGAIAQSTDMEIWYNNLYKI